jgi:translation initiation factor IF-3
LSRPFPPRFSSSGSSGIRVNGKIRAREVRVIGPDSQQLGVLSLGDAINKARSLGVDLVEVAPNANPPVCRLVDYGKYLYEQQKKAKESKKHQHSNKVKEIQLSPSIDPHDFQVKLNHAVEFLCDEMKVKISLRFRGREMAHKEFGFQTVEKFIKEVSAYGHPDAPTRLVGRGLNVMISPLHRSKRAKSPKELVGDGAAAATYSAPAGSKASPTAKPPLPLGGPKQNSSHPPRLSSGGQAAGGFSNNPFAKLDAPKEESGDSAASGS